MPLKEIITSGSQLVWLLVSIMLLVHLKVFNRRSLLQAPPRRSNLTMLSVAAVFLLYVGMVAATQAGLAVFQRSQAGTEGQREQATTQTPVRGVSTGTEQESSIAAPTSGPTTAVTPAPEAATVPAAPIVSAGDTFLEMVVQLADAFTKLVPVLLILILCRVLVVGGIDGWGLSVRKIPQGIVLGLLGFLVIYPLLIVCNILVTTVVHALDKGHKDEIHPTLTLISQQGTPVYQQVVFVLVAGLFAPVLEEIFFRGLIQTVMIERGWGFSPRENVAGLGETFKPDRTKVSPGEDRSGNGETPQVLQHQAPGAWMEGATPGHRWLAIVVASAIFAGIHLMPDSFVVLFVLAVGLGYVYERTGNLWACIVLHSAFNCLNMYLFTRGG